MELISLEQRGLLFTRYADDVLIFTKSEMVANRVVNFIISRDVLENRIKDRAGLLNPLSY